MVHGQPFCIINPLMRGPPLSLYVVLVEYSSNTILYCKFSSYEIISREFVHLHADFITVCGMILLYIYTDRRIHIRLQKWYSVSFLIQMMFDFIVL